MNWRRISTLSRRTFARLRVPSATTILTPNRVTTKARKMSQCMWRTPRRFIGWWIRVGTNSMLSTNIGLRWPSIASNSLLVPKSPTRAKSCWTVVTHSSQSSTPSRVATQIASTKSTCTMTELEWSERTITADERFERLKWRPENTVWQAVRLSRVPVWLYTN